MQWTMPKIFILKNSTFTSSSFAHPSKLSYRRFIGVNLAL